MRSLLLSLLLAGLAAADEFAPNHLFIASFSSGVLEYDEAGALIDTHEFLGATDVAFGPNGHLFIARGASGVTEIDGTGAEVRSYLPPNSCYYRGVAIGPDGSVYAADFNGDRVDVFFGPDGSFLGSYTHVDLDGLQDVTFGADGHFWVISQNTQKLIEFDPAGVPLRSFDVPVPLAVTFAPDGNLLVGAYHAGLLLIDPVSGNLADSVAATHPGGVTVGPDGRIRTVDADGGLLEVFSKDAAVLTPGGSQPIATAGSTGGVAYSPARFKVRLKGSKRGETQNEKINALTTISITPGTGVVVLDLAGVSGLGDTFVGYGTDAWPNLAGKRRSILASELGFGAMRYGVSSIALDVKGKVGPDGDFMVQHATGRFHRAELGTVIDLAVETKNPLN